LQGRWARVTRAVWIGVSFSVARHGSASEV
jgi:hypothetical protein